MACTCRQVADRTDNKVYSLPTRERPKSTASNELKDVDAIVPAIPQMQEAFQE